RLRPTDGPGIPLHQLPRPGAEAHGRASPSGRPRAIRPRDRARRTANRATHGGHARGAAVTHIVQPFRVDQKGSLVLESEITHGSGVSNIVRPTGKSALHYRDKILYFAIKPENASLGPSWRMDLDSLRGH